MYLCNGSFEIFVMSCMISSHLRLARPMTGGHDRCHTITVVKFTFNVNFMNCQYQYRRDVNQDLFFRIQLKNPEVPPM